MQAFLRVKSYRANAFSARYYCLCSIFDSDPDPGSFFVLLFQEIFRSGTNSIFCDEWRYKISPNLSRCRVWLTPVEIR